LILSETLPEAFRRISGPDIGGHMNYLGGGFADFKIFFDVGTRTGR
jgi:hypothetical protein